MPSSRYLSTAGQRLGETVLDSQDQTFVFGSPVGRGLGHYLSRARQGFSLREGIAVPIPTPDDGLFNENREFMTLSRGVSVELN